jgi:hypothetical protein
MEAALDQAGTNAEQSKAAIRRLRRNRPASGSAAGDEGNDDVGGVAIEILAAPVVYRWWRVAVSCRQLHLTKRDTSVKGGGFQQ